MTLKKDDMINVVSLKLSTPANVAEGTWSAIIDEAVDMYSSYRPLNKVIEASGNGGFDYDLPSDFIENFSSILSLEYPYDSTSPYPNTLKPAVEFTIYPSPTTFKLRFLGYTPDASELYRLTYTTQHVLTLTTSTIPAVDERAVINLACGLLAETLATEYEKKTRTAFPDATIDLKTKSQEYQTQADRFYDLWRLIMNISKFGKPNAASVIVDTDWTATYGPPLIPRKQ